MDLGKENFMESLNWVGKQRVKGSTSGADVSIYVSPKTEKHSAYVNVTLRNKCWEKAFPSGFAKMAIYQDRVLFADTNAANGIKVSPSKKSENIAYVKFTTDGEPFKDFIGDYELKFEQFYGIYYVGK